MTSPARRRSLLITVLLVVPLLCCASPAAFAAERPKSAPVETVVLTVVSEQRGPLIGPGYAGTEGNLAGFETGHLVSRGGVAHLFVNEMFGRPHLDLRIAHWTSRDGEHWTRQGTVIDSVQGRSHENLRSEVWINGVVFDPAEQRWNLFYVAYRGGDSSRGEMPRYDYDGKIWRAVSQTPGEDGVSGPYRDVDIVMQPDGNSLPWEGQQGVDSFFPYRVGTKWYAFYGSHNHQPRGPWSVGLAEAPALKGAWTRLPEHSPTRMVREFIENPIVYELGQGRLIALYDSDVPYGIGYSLSSDGINWTPETTLIVQGETNRWAGGNGLYEMRTPLGLMPRGDGKFILLYTAKIAGGSFYAIGQCVVSLQPSRP